MKPRGFPEDPQTLGEHLFRARCLRKTSQKEAASLLGVSSESLLNWEKGKTEPPVRSWPAILRFLGYDPSPEPKALSERMLAKRRELGWTIREAAERLGVDEGTWGIWEHIGRIRWNRYRAILEAFLDG